MGNKDKIRDKLPQDVEVFEDPCPLPDTPVVSIIKKIIEVFTKSKK